MQMCYLFMETNGATLPSGSVRDSFGIRSGFEEQSKKLRRSNENASEAQRRHNKG